MHYPTRPYHNNRIKVHQEGMQGRNLKLKETSGLWDETAARDATIHQIGEIAAGEVEIDLIAVERAAKAGDEVAQYISELLDRVLAEDLEQAG